MARSDLLIYLGVLDVCREVGWIGLRVNLSGAPTKIHDLAQGGYIERAEPTAGVRLSAAADELPRSHIFCQVMSMRTGI